MTHNLLRCELWLGVLEQRVDDLIEGFRWGLDWSQFEKVWMAIWFVTGVCE